EKHRSAFAETIEVQIECSRRDCERSPLGQFDDRRKLPTTESLAQQAFVSTKKRQPISAVHREAMRRVETREGACFPGVVSILIAVAGTNKGRFRGCVSRFAPGVSSLEIEIAAQTLGPFELHRVVVTPRCIRYREVGPIETIRPAFVYA